MRLRAVKHKNNSTLLILTKTFLYLDETIAKEISSDKGFNFLFNSLDHGNFLKKIDDAVEMNDGLVLFSGAAHLQSTLQKIDWSHFGLLHTGQIGDLVMGSYLSGPNHTDTDSECVKQIAYSTKLLSRIPESIFQEMNRYENSEIFAFYTRCVNGVFNGYRVIEHFTEFSLPFLDKDFLDYALRIPPQYRYKEKIYKKWILKKYPEANRYIWEKTRSRIDTSNFEVSLRSLIRSIISRVNGPNGSFSMNPFQHWFATNQTLMYTFDEYFKGNFYLLKKYSALSKDAKYLYDDGFVIEKTQVLTLISALKRYKFDE